MLDVQAEFVWHKLSADNMDPDFVERRRVGLENFLLRVASHPVLSNDKILFHFLTEVRTFCVVVWFGNLSLANKNRLDRLVRVASKVIGVNQVQLSELYVRQIVRKTQAISACTEHPLKGGFELLPSGRR